MGGRFNRSFRADAFGESASIGSGRRPGPPIGEAPALAALQAQLGDPHPLARTYAAVALGEMGEAASPALPKLKQLSRARDYRVSGAAREAVSQIRGLPSPARRLGAY